MRCETKKSFKNEMSKLQQWLRAEKSFKLLYVNMKFIPFLNKNVLVLSDYNITR